MRKIKFRAWDSKTGVMFTPDAIMNDGTARPVLKLSKKRGMAYKDCPVMQFTGLLDKNGKEIYEGDILEFPSGERRKVLWQATLACFQHEALDYSRWGQLDEMMATKCEIIGNVYENPELLQEQQ